MKTVKRSMLMAAGIVALALGLVGLAMPLLPGVLFLAVAMVCFSAASNRLRRRLHASPRIRPYLVRWEASRGLGVARRLRLAFWLALATAGDSLRGTRGVLRRG